MLRKIQEYLRKHRRRSDAIGPSAEKTGQKVPRKPKQNNSRGTWHSRQSEQGQALPNRLREHSQDEELKCPTSDEEDNSMMDDYEAPSVAPDEDMASPEDAVMTVES